MQTEGRSDEQQRLWTPNKNLKDGLPFLLKDLPVRGLVARAARLRPPPRLTVTANFCCGGVDTRLLLGERSSAALETALEALSSVRRSACSWEPARPAHRERSGHAATQLKNGQNPLSERNPPCMRGYSEAQDIGGSVPYMEREGTVCEGRGNVCTMGLQ